MKKNKKPVVLCYSRCTTCKRALEWLKERNIEFDERDIKGDNPSADELKKWYGESGLNLKRFYNTSGMKYKELGLKDKIPTMSEDEQFDLLATDGLLVKRPLVVGDGFILTGFKEKEWEEAFEK